MLDSRKPNQSHRPVKKSCLPQNFSPLSVPSALQGGWCLGWPGRPAKLCGSLLGSATWALHSAGSSSWSIALSQSTEDRNIETEIFCTGELQAHTKGSCDCPRFRGVTDSAVSHREWKTGTVMPGCCHLLWLLCLACSRIAAKLL